MHLPSRPHELRRVDLLDPDTPGNPAPHGPSGVGIDPLEGTEVDAIEPEIAMSPPESAEVDEPLAPNEPAGELDGRGADLQRAQARAGHIANLRRDMELGQRKAKDP